MYFLMRQFKPISLYILKPSFPLRVTPKFEVKNENDYFFYLSEGMENCKMSWKNQGKVREF